MKRWLIIAAAGAVAAAAFWLSRAPKRPPAPAKAAPVAWTGPTGTIEGEVTLAGAQPEPARLHREADPFCARTPMTDPEVLVSAGKLANVWLRVSGAPDAAPPDAALVIDQRDCMYVPRVGTAVLGQKIVARNSDPVLHNIHATLDGSTLFNRGLPNEKAPPFELTAAEPGLMKWKCDVHPWMRGYVGVSNNALQAVSGADGAFRIEKVPPGQYTLEAWHEKLGLKSQPVAVEAGKTARAAFGY